MKKYVELSIFAEGDYSGATYEESRFLTEEIWETIKDNFNRKFYKYELDGKHSCCECYFEVEEYTEEWLSKMKVSDNCDGDDLFFRLMETMTEHNYEKPDEILWKIRDEIIDLYQYTEVTVKVRKDNVDKLKEFIKELQ